MEKGYAIDWILGEAALYGYIKLCEKAMMLGSNNINWALMLAGEGGHSKIFIKLLQVGAECSHINFEYAAYGGHRNLCEKILHFFPGLFILSGSFDMALVSAAADAGHLDICEWLIQLEAGELDEAAEKGHLHICELLIRTGARDFQYAIKVAKDDRTKEFLINWWKMS